MKKAIIILCTLICPFIIGAQTISGKVLDDMHKPVAGAIVWNKSSNAHYHSNELGRFYAPSCKIGDTLEISHIAFYDQFYIVDSTKSLLIQLTEKQIDLQEIIVRPDQDILSSIQAIDIQNNPVNSSQDVLRQVPGLFMGQHAGGGKAEQIFLRGFDIDHGTDLAISVDGLPVNMVSHAHGQGYADLHFVIPEAIEHIQFGKGPYYAEQGNFNTAGYVDFQLKSTLDQSLLKIEKGQFNSNRFLGMFQLNEDGYIATEYQNTDGPFESPQHFNRLNILGKYKFSLDATNALDITASHFTSSWDASGQVPQRAIDNGTISRFGAIDDTEGGSTSRTNISIGHQKFIQKNSFIKSKIHYSNYNFDLFSNFTFFLEDAENGDQIRQTEKRDLFALQSTYYNQVYAGATDIDFTAGFQFRTDDVDDVALSRTANRQSLLERLQWGDIKETNTSAFINAAFHLQQFTINAGLRNDQFHYQYYDQLVENYKQQALRKNIFSPKISVQYTPNQQWQLYSKFGKGFHSNDSRVVLNNSSNFILPAAYGFDVRTIWKPWPSVFINAAYWYLFSEQEFVYVGDAGIVEASGSSKRHGGELSIRYQPKSWLHIASDINYTDARAQDAGEGEDFIPLAPKLTATASINTVFPNGISLGLKGRHMGDRAANEDQSIIAKGYTVLDFNGSYRFKNVDFGLHIQNVFDVEWNETQFATESRLKGETNSVEEIHFTPGTPFFLKASVAFRF